jgi:hypothetical protein
MKDPIDEINYYFVDESGDPAFYNKNGTLIVGNEGCSKILIMGFVESKNPKQIRTALDNLRKELLNDPYLLGIPSIEKTKKVFHAKDDCPEVRQAVFKKLLELDFKAQFVVARKIEQVFRKRFNCNENKFYDHLISSLFQNVLHRYSNNRIIFAVRGSKNRQQPLNQAIIKAASTFEKKWNASIFKKIEIDITAQSLLGEPCLQVIDYLNWAVYRAFTKKEMRFYKTIEEKVSLIVDLYDSRNYPNNWYSRKNPFDSDKISPI